jgi:uncharacterized protein (DUF305 family)
MALAWAAACGGTRPQAPAPEIPVAAATNRHTAADVKFMQHMIVHHAQALEMAKLVPARSTRETMHQMAGRIDASQVAEIARMRQWLEARNVPVADDRLHAGEHVHMPGMASADELARLESLRGSEFDLLFLELMIRHHEGALVMVRELFATEGAANEAGLYMMAASIDADQRAEIARMRGLLETLQRGSE